MSDAYPRLSSSASDKFIADYITARVTFALIIRQYTVTHNIPTKIQAKITYITMQMTVKITYNYANVG